MCVYIIYIYIKRKMRALLVYVLENWRSRESGKFRGTAGSWRPMCDVGNVGMNKWNGDKLINERNRRVP